MARVPRYDLERRVQGVSGVQQNISAPRDAFGSGEGLEALGAGLSQVAGRMEQMRQEDDAIRAEKAYQEYYAQLREAEYGDNGFLNQTGENATTRSEDHMREVDALREKIGGTLSEGQRVLFNERSQSRREQALDSASRHTATQRRAVQVETFGVTAEDAAEFATRAPNDEILQGAINEVGAAVRAQSALLGRSPEATAEAVETAQSQALVGAVTAAVDRGDIERASHILSTHADGMDPVMVQQARTLIEGADRRGQSQREADEIMARGLSEADALRAARDIEDPEVRDMVVQRVQARYVDQRRFEEEAEAQAFEDVYEALQGGASLDDIPNSQWATLSVTQQATLQTIQQGFRHVSEFDALLEIDRMSPTELAEMTTDEIATYRERLSRQDWDRLRASRASARSAIASGQDFTPTPGRGLPAQMNDVLEQYGYDSNDDPEQAAAFFARGETALSEFEEQAGRRATPSERNEILHGVMSEEIRVTHRGFFTPDAESYRGAVVFEGIPLAHQDAVLAAFPEASVSQRDVLTIYNAAVASLTADGYAVTPERLEEEMRDDRAAVARAALEGDK